MRDQSVRVMMKNSHTAEYLPAFRDLWLTMNTAIKEEILVTRIGAGLIFSHLPPLSMYPETTDWFSDILRRTCLALLRSCYGKMLLQQLFVNPTASVLLPNQNA